MKITKTIPLLLTFTFANLLQAKEPAKVIDPAAKAILEKALDAAGGKEAMTKIKSRTIKGELSMPAQGMTMKLLITHKAPGQYYNKMEMPNVMTVEQGYDGETAWSKDSIQGMRKLAGAELQQAKESSAIFPELTIMENLTSAELLENVKDGDKTLQVLKVNTKDAPEKTLYFDEKTKLLQKMETMSVTGPGGAMKSTTIFSDFKEQDGVKFPNSMQMSVMGQKMNIKFTEVKHNIEVDDAIFKMPK